MSASFVSLSFVDLHSWNLDFRDFRDGTLGTSGVAIFGLWKFAQLIVSHNLRCNGKVF